MFGLQSNIIVKIIAIMILFLLFDSVYLTLIAKHFTNVVERIQKTPFKLDMYKAGVVYILLTIGMYHFIIKHITKFTTKRDLTKLIINAFILGIVIYGTYDFTTGALFTNYDIYTALIDTLWGGILHVLITYSYYSLYKLL